MAGSLSKIAPLGRSRSKLDRLAAGLGYFSIALGLAELIAPKSVARVASVEGQERLIRVFGLREFLNGVGILGSHNATGWLWARVAGDVVDIGSVFAAPEKRLFRRSNRGWTLLALLGVTALDAFAASAIAAQRSGRFPVDRDYRPRSGFPKGLEWVRTAALQSSGATTNAAQQREHTRLTV